MNSSNLIPQAILALEDGTIFRGIAIGVSGMAVGELIFNTSLTGYQEILTDPSYARQIVTLTYPHIGNVGTNPEDVESNQTWVAGLVIRDLPLISSNWRSTLPLDDYLKQNQVVGIAEIDTRKLTHILRNKGAMKACIMAGEAINENAAIAEAEAFAGLQGMDLAKEVTIQKSYQWDQPSWQLEKNVASNIRFSQHIVVYDYGVKQNILRLLVDQGCRVTVVPAQTSAADVIAMQPDGIVLSNGPGDPAACHYAISAIQQLLETQIPLFGICLGFQLLGLACGAKTNKMKFGHHGSNHPVEDIASKRVLITSQNHCFAIDEASLPKSLRATHRSLFDGSLQGIEHVTKPAFGFQGHPEASPGPHDLSPLFDRFFQLCQNVKT
ncbi:glutamine-hydrolyzing carbamoyl-phosphate synthase small subunit [soil metagenome]